MNYEVGNNILKISVDSEIYNIDVLHKCFYWYGGEYNVDIEQAENKKFSITVSPKNNKAISEETDFLIEKIKRDLIDFKLRDIVTKETQTVRELITAKAFAYFDLNENPTTEVSDPVGFDPTD